MADTDALRPFKRGDPPTIPGSEKGYQQEQLRNVQDSIATMIAVMKKLEARMAAHGI